MKGRRRGYSDVERRQSGQSLDVAVDGVIEACLAQAHRAAQVFFCVLDAVFIDPEIAAIWQDSGHGDGLR
jgi:hypothetical protein